jgi:hypothetical protein
MRRVLIAAAGGMLLLLLGIFMLIYGNLSANQTALWAAILLIPLALGLIGWSVFDRNQRL